MPVLVAANRDLPVAWPGVPGCLLHRPLGGALLPGGTCRESSAFDQAPSDSNLGEPATGGEGN